MKICLLTSVRNRYDIRLFLKQGKSLKKAGYDVSLIVADNQGDIVIDEIKIYDVGKEKNRIRRLIKTTFKIYKKASSLNADIYHFHDVELVFIAYILKRKGKKIIYDVHEDYPRQMVYKYYMPLIMKKLVAIIVEIIENYLGKKYDFIIANTPYIRDRFLKINNNTIDINNYPILDEFNSINNWTNKRSEICYIGGIEKVRSIIEIVDALEFLNVKLHLVGDFSPPSLLEEIKKKKGWRYIKYYGYLDREKIVKILKISKIGLVITHPVENLMIGHPVKMFEYMAAGIPVIASNFTLWKKIVEGHNCGLCVNPLDKNDISVRIKYLLENDEEAKKMGENGRKIVYEKFNWKNEEVKLLSVYDKLLNDNRII